MVGHLAGEIDNQHLQQQQRNLQVDGLQYQIMQLQLLRCQDGEEVHQLQLQHVMVEMDGVQHHLHSHHTLLPLHWDILPPHLDRRHHLDRFLAVFLHNHLRLELHHHHQYHHQELITTFNHLLLQVYLLL